MTVTAHDDGTLYGKFNKMSVGIGDSPNRQPMELSSPSGFFSSIKGIWTTVPDTGPLNYTLDLTSIRESEIRIQDENTGNIFRCYIESEP